MAKKIVLLAALLLFTLNLGLAASAEAPTTETDTMPQAVYTGRVVQNSSIRVEMSRESEALAQLKEGEKAYILEYEPGWLLVVHGNEEKWVTGYVLRHTVHDVTPIAADSVPYGATPATYSCVLGKDTNLFTAPDKDSDYIQTLAEGTKMAVIDVQDGWAKVIRWRDYAYFYLDGAQELTPVYDYDTAESGDTLSAFVSFFNLSTAGLNPNRILNIEKACEYITMTLEPGEDFSFNGIAGPYRKTRGYLEAPSFVDGETVPSYGGGTCQVSSTLYNVLLPLKNHDITIVYRVAHGAAGAVYLPHGVDAACGNERIDLKFRNDYAYPVRIEASAKEGVLYIALLKE